MQNRASFNVRRLAVTGLLAALVFIFSWMQIPIGQIARIHLGNVFCALSGLLFGPGSPAALPPASAACCSI